MENSTNIQTLLKTIQGLRSSYRRTGFLYYISGTFVGISGIFTVFVLTDLLIGLPSFCRWLAFLSALLVFISGIVLALNHIRSAISDAAIAAKAEQAMNGFENRLINVVQLARGNLSEQQHSKRILKEASLPITKLNTSHVFPTYRFKSLSIILLGIFAILGSNLVINAEGTSTALLRALFPMKTIRPFNHTRLVNVEPGDTRIRRGESLEFTVETAGRIPGSPTLFLHIPNSSSKEYRLRRKNQTSNKTDTIQFQARIEELLNKAEYHIQAENTSSKRYTIKITTPPQIKTWKAVVTPPRHMGKSSFKLNPESQKATIPAGADVRLKGETDKPLSGVKIIQNGNARKIQKINQKTRFSLSFTAGNSDGFKLTAVGVDGLQNIRSLPFSIMPDTPPNIKILNDKRRIETTPHDTVNILFKAVDDYGVNEVRLQRARDENSFFTLRKLDSRPANTEQFESNFEINLARLNVSEGTFSFRLMAMDSCNVPKAQKGYSKQFQITIKDAAELSESKEKARKKILKKTNQLVRLQKQNLRRTRKSQLHTLQKNLVTKERCAQLTDFQREIRNKATILLQTGNLRGFPRNLLSTLVNNEMREVVQNLGSAETAESVTAQQEPLTKALKLETTILSRLLGLVKQIDHEKEFQTKADLIAQLKKMVKSQQKNIENSRGLRQNQKARKSFKKLSEKEDRIAEMYINFTDQCWITLKKTDDKSFNKKLRKVYNLYKDKNVYASVLTAAEALAKEKQEEAIEYQKNAYQTMRLGLKILNKWRLNNANRKLTSLQKTLDKTLKELKNMKDKQAEITEITRQLKQREELNDSVRDKLGAMDKQQEDMADTIEKLAQDLYQFPELPVCNNLNSQMKTLFEDVQQAQNSEDTPAMEIAVQKEDSFLKAIKNTEKRVEDIEMWLPEKPDQTAWNKESFDTDEVPDMPLVDLPKELEDMVGELLKQDEDVTPEAQDATGNNMMADGEMGWEVKDGPIPNFSAKGKSGNTKPNDNEMTGRSGAGREGQSTGELVEDKIKGLEGRKTHARRTRDPMQKGLVEESKESQLTARSTGGGKLGGQSESQGMFGKAPRRDLLQLPAGSKRAKQLTREFKALYTKARLLYIRSGKLGAVSQEIQRLSKSPDIKNIDTTQQTILRYLQQTKAEIKSGAPLPMPITVSAKTGGISEASSHISELPEEYRNLVSEYFQKMQQ